MSYWGSLLIPNPVLFSTNSRNRGKSEILPRQEALDLDSQASNPDVI